MNVEKVNALEQIKATLGRAYKSAERQFQDPFSDPASICEYLLTRMHMVAEDINDLIKEEDDAVSDFYEQVSAEKAACLTASARKDEPSSMSEANRRSGNSCLNPLIDTCADEISKVFNNCWVGVRAERQNGKNPEYVITIQPDNHNTPNDIQLMLKSLGYAPTFKSIRELSSAAWADFEVNRNGIAFELTATVSSIEPPELERYGEPATDEELPF